MIINFTDIEAVQAARSGGKGSSLARLTQAGFRVPEGFIVAAGVYDRWLAQADDLPAWLAGLPEDDPAALTSACLELQRRLAALPLPEGLEAALAGRLAGEAKDGFWAVRSSATTEDLAQAAFAGQHATFLGCSESDILMKIRDCWLSLWSDRAVDYRRRAGFGLAEASMAVVVQRLVDSEAAGVGFSLDPVTGRTDRLVFDANYGLGESVVSGEVEVDHYRLSRGEGDVPPAVEISIIGAKDRMIVRDGREEGSVWRPVPEEMRTRPALDEGRLEELARLLLAAERFYGHPVDIEWALASPQSGPGDGGAAFMERHFGRVEAESPSSLRYFYLLQARPITRIPPRWTRDEAAERFPNAVTPLTWDFVERGFHLSLNHSLALMGLPPYQDKWFELFDHYIYGNQNAVDIYAERLPFTFNSLGDFVEKIPELVERFAWVWDLPVAWARNLDRYLLRLGRLDSRIDRAETLKDLWSLVGELQKIGEDYFLPNIAISISQRTLHRLVLVILNYLAGPEEAPAAMDAVMAGCETKTGAVNRDMKDLAKAIVRAPLLAETLLSRPSSDFLAGGGFSGWPEIDRRFQLFLEDHGHREVDYDPYMPTWSGAPEHVIEHLKSLAQRPEILAGREEPRIIASRAEEDLLKRTPEELRVALRELIRLTRSYTSLDDLEHYQTTRLYPPFRKLMLKIGRELKALGLTAEEGDVFFCRMDELGRAIGSGRLEGLKEAAAAEKKAYLRHKEKSPKWNLLDDEAPLEEKRDGLLKGLAGSPGEAEGRVFVVASPDDFALFPDGAVLVARTTNPAWTPLFYKAAAVITESGGPLSHGAVTAREMGLPAVMAVRDLLRLVSNGQLVRVRGREGLVEILEG